MRRDPPRPWSRTITPLQRLALAMSVAVALVVASSCSHTSDGTSAALDAAGVERDANGDLIVTWTGNDGAGDVAVYAGTDPDAILREAPIGSGGSSGSVRASGLDPARRWYFAVVAGDGELVTAERRVPFEGAVNFRDVGGYRNGDGRHVRWGQVYRSDELDGLSTTDLKLFSSLDVKLLCDFRSPGEVGRNPDRLPANDPPEVLHLPIYDPENDVESLITQAITSGDHELQDRLLGGGRNEQLLVDAGRTLVLDATEQYSACLRRLADPASLPALTHCTAGKDRTGFSSAILLLALGVPEDTVMQDYLLSNVYRAEANERTIASVAPLMRDPELLRPVLEVRPEYLQASFDTIREVYGDVATYLRDGLGLDDATLRALRTNLLD